MVEIFRHDLTLMNHELWDCGYTHAIITVFGFGCLLVDHHPQANSWRLCSRLFSYTHSVVMQAGCTKQHQNIYKQRRTLMHKRNKVFRTIA